MPGHLYNGGGSDAAKSCYTVDCTYMCLNTACFVVITTVYETRNVKSVYKPDRFFPFLLVEAEKRVWRASQTRCK